MVSLKFHDANYPQDMFASIRKHPKTELNQLIIELEFDVSLSDEGYQSISLNRETAIKLSKELRKQIALLD